MSMQQSNPRLERARALRERAAQIIEAAEHSDHYDTWYRERLRARELEAEAQRLEQEADG